MCVPPNGDHDKEVTLRYKIIYKQITEGNRIRLNQLTVGLATSSNI